MNVFILDVCEPYDDSYHIAGVFSSEEKVKDYIDKINLQIKIAKEHFENIKILGIVDLNDLHEYIDDNNDYEYNPIFTSYIEKNNIDEEIQGIIIDLYTYVDYGVAFSIKKFEMDSLL